jgi:prepilin-type N-terminal cleavage/methylation domain-containing protein
MKNNKGFTLIEVLMALFILTGSVFVLSDLQIKSIFRTLKSRDEINRIFLIKEKLYSNYINPPKKTKKVVDQTEEPETTSTVEISEIEKSSELRDFVDDIHIVSCLGEWQSNDDKFERKMISFILKPKEKEKKSEA